MNKKILVYGMTDNKGGIESYIMSLYRNTQKEKIQFDFVVDFPAMAFSEEVLANGSQIYYIPSKSSAPIKHLRAFKKILKEHPEYEAVYFNVLNAGAAYTMSAVKSMKRKVYVHSHNSCDENMRLHRLFKPLLLRYADKKLACSVGAAEYMFGSREDVLVVNNAIDLDQFIFSQEKRDKKRAEFALEEHTFAVFHAGRMAYAKNPLFLIEIFSEIVKKFPDSVLLYAGTGIMEVQVKELAQNLGVSQKVRFLGMRDDVPEIYQAADVFLLPSLFEGLPVVLVEAQAAGLQTFTSENVSRDAGLTDCLSFISLEKSAACWADAILAAKDAPRQNMKTEMEAAGYSAENEMKRVQEFILA